MQFLDEDVVQPHHAQIGVCICHRDKFGIDAGHDCETFVVHDKDDDDDDDVRKLRLPKFRSRQVSLHAEMAALCWGASNLIQKETLPARNEGHELWVKTMPGFSRCFLPITKLYEEKTWETCSFCWLICNASFLTWIDFLIPVDNWFAPSPSPSVIRWISFRAQVCQRLQGQAVEWCQLFPFPCTRELRASFPPPISLFRLPPKPCPKFSTTASALSTFTSLSASVVELFVLTTFIRGEKSIFFKSLVRCGG